MKRGTADGLLLLAAFIWGTAFVAQKMGMASIGPFMFTGVRFLLGGIVLLPLVWREWRRLHRQGVVFDRSDYFSWIGVGLILSGGAIFQQIGVPDTTVSNAGFLTALYVPLVPILAWALEGRPPHYSVWPAVIACIIGVYFLGQGTVGHLTNGDWWVIASSIFWTAHVVIIGKVAAKKQTPLTVAFVQFMVCGLLGLLLGLCLESTTLAGLHAATPAILYTGVLSVSIGYTLQVIAQGHTHPAEAAIVLSSEFLFATLAGAIYYGERLTLPQSFGITLIFVAIVYVQIAPLLDRRRRT